MHGKDFFIFGLNHRSSPIEIREKASFSPQKLALALHDLNSNPRIQSSIILSTCNRVELYCIGSQDLQEADLRSFLARFHSLREQDLEQYSYFLKGRKGLEHLFRVAASLDSIMVGEKQILGQIKQAYLLSQSLGCCSENMKKFFMSALRTGHEAQFRTKIGAGAISISSVAVRMLKDIFGELKDKTVLIVGAGKITRFTIDHLRAFGVNNVLISNHTYEEALDLARSCNAKAVGFWDTPALMKFADIVITSASAPHAIIEPGIVQKSMSLRKGRPLFFIDLSVPRNVDPLVRDVPGVYLYDIDDLAAVKDHDLAERTKEIRKVEDIIERELNVCGRFFEACAHGQTEVRSKAHASLPLGSSQSKVAGI